MGPSGRWCRWAGWGGTWVGAASGPARRGRAAQPAPEELSQRVPLAAGDEEKGVELHKAVDAGVPVKVGACVRGCRCAGAGGTGGEGSRLGL